MYDIPIDQLVDKTKSIYKLAILTARRAGELGDGATRLVDSKPDEKAISVALREILAGKVDFKVLEKK